MAIKNLYVHIYKSKTNIDREGGIEILQAKITVELSVSFIMISNAFL